MVYQYRWIYAALCVLFTTAAGYWIDLQSLLSERTRLASAIKIAEARAARVRAPVTEVKQENIMIHVSANFSLLSNLLQRYHLQLEDVQQVDTEASVNAGKQIRVSGQYAKLYQFMTVLAACRACRMSALVLTPVSDQQVQAIINLQLSDDIQFADLPASVNPVINPFCGADIPAKNNHAQRAKFETLRLLGTVTYDHKHSAIIAFPDGVISEIAVDDVLGSEGGKVVDIAEDQVIVLFPDHSRRKIS